MFSKLSYVHAGYLFYPVTVLYSQTTICLLHRHCSIRFKLSLGLHDKTRLVWSVPGENRIHLTSKQWRRRHTHMAHALSAHCVGLRLSACDRRGVGSAAVSGAQQTNSQNAFVYWHAHTLDCHSRTASIRPSEGNVVASLSAYLVICLPKPLINGKHSAYVRETLIASVVKAKLRVLLASGGRHVSHWDDKNCVFLIFGSYCWRRVEPSRSLSSYATQRVYNTWKFW